jgi:branched-chain amino acid transport system ATP-binding protein
VRVLTVKDVRASYGRVEVLKGISIEVRPGAIVALLGANGAGKTTTLRIITGLLSLTTGRLEFHGKSIAGVRSDRIVRKGISMVPEGRELFLEMTVEENLEMGAFTRRDANGIRDDFSRMYQIFPRLEERRSQIAGTLSGGEQQMLAIARALMCRPKLLLLDEPSLGLAPALVEEIFATIGRINKEGTSILLVEQNAEMALDVASYVYVLETGRISLSGTAAELAADSGIQESYLGRSGGQVGSKS